MFRRQQGFCGPSCNMKRNVATVLSWQTEPNAPAGRVFASLIKSYLAAHLRRAVWMRFISYKFRSSLSARTASLYGVLFAATVVFILLGAEHGTQLVARGMIERDFAAEKSYLGDLREHRYEEMTRDAGFLSADFGFRSAIVSNDLSTIESSIANVQARVDREDVFVILSDGTAIGLDSSIDKADRGKLLAAIMRGATRGIIELGDVNYYAVAVPVLVPDKVGWVTLLARFSNADTQRAGRLSSLPMQLSLLTARQLKRQEPLLIAGTSAPVEHSRFGHRLIVQATPVASFGPNGHQALLIKYDLTEALERYRPIFLFLTSFCAIGLVLAVGGSWALARRLTAPVRELEQAAREVGAGEHRQVSVRTIDELGRLSSAFNAMVTELAAQKQAIIDHQRSATGELQQTVARVEAENQYLNVLAKQQRQRTLSEAAERLNDSLTPVLSGLSFGGSKLQSSASGLEASLDVSSDQTGQAAKAAEQTKQRSLSIATSADDLAAAGDTIARQAHDTRQTVQTAAKSSLAARHALSHLQTAAQHIRDVTAEISSISGQTNLLAVNAAIEAARTGEAGLGFAIVAAEVKSLSHKTGALTQSVEQRLVTLENAMQEADAAATNVDKALTLAADASTNIAAAAARQSLATTTIRDTLAGISDDTQVVVEAITRIEGAGCDNRLIADSVNVSAEDMKLRVVDLRTAVSEFLSQMHEEADGHRKASPHWGR